MIIAMTHNLTHAYLSAICGAQARDRRISR